MPLSRPSTPRAALVCGPYLSGKSTLFEALLGETDSLKKRPSPDAGFTVADQAPEARTHGVSTETNIATTQYLGQTWTFLDCPGSVELMGETRAAASVADIAVVVAEPGPDKAVLLQAYFSMLDGLGVPHILFINKFDKNEVSARALLAAFQTASARPLVLREIPIREGGRITGHVDLVSERAFHWQEGKPSSLIALPDALHPREDEARSLLFESLADFDDTLLEKLLEDVTPSSDEIYDNLARDLSANLVVPVFFGSALHGNGVHRLMKALRHESPDVTMTAERQGIKAAGGRLVRVFKTVQAGHAGKVSVGRVMRGEITDGDTLDGARPAGLRRMFGQKMIPVHQLAAGDVAGFTKLEDARTGDLLGPDSKVKSETGRTPPLFSLAIKTAKRGDEVKLPDALQKILAEDPTLFSSFDEMTGDHILQGQGEMHLALALERLHNRAGLEVEGAPCKIAYRETIRKPVTKRVRHKKQSGGHGEFGEVELKLTPIARGEGFRFHDEIKGGVVPRQYIPAIKAGILETMKTGAQGFPLVDVEVVLTDGKFHSVDSSELAFRKAAAEAMREALASAGSILLEPVNKVTIIVPGQYIAAVQKVVLAHRGQIFGFSDSTGQSAGEMVGQIGYDGISCQIPAAEMQTLITEIRAKTMGTGTFEASFDHLQELGRKEADALAAP